MLIGCSVISNILNLIRTFLFTDTTNRIDIATSGNILTHLFKLPLGYFDRDRLVKSPQDFLSLAVFVASSQVLP